MRAGVAETEVLAELQGVTFTVNPGICSGPRGRIRFADHRMSDPNYGPRPDPAQSQSSRFDNHKAKSHREQKEYPRDTNRRNERQDNGDRVRTGPVHENEYHSPEKRANQDRRLHIQDKVRDRPREDKSRDGKEASRERHREDRSRQPRHPEDVSRDKENESRDGHRADRSRQQRYLEDRYLDREEGRHDRHREERSRDKVEVNRYKEEGTQNRYWEERSPDKHWEKSSSHEKDRYWGEKSHSIPPNPQEMNFHQESSYYKRDVLPMGYAPPPRSPAFDEREYYESEPEGGILDCNKCRYLCTGRACCQMVEVLLNMLILVCASVSYNSTGGFTGITNMGGIYYYAYGGAYSGFDGADGETAQKLDVQFYQLKLPTASATMAFGGALMGFSCLMVVVGVFRLPWYFPVWLLVECILDSLIACGYLPALYFYFRKLLDAYETQVCKDRETLYRSKGYPGFSCALHGADIAAGLFGCLSIVAFAMSAVLAVRGFRRVRIMKSQQSAQKLEL